MTVLLLFLCEAITFLKMVETPVVRLLAPTTRNEEYNKEPLNEQVPTRAPQNLPASLTANFFSRW